MAECAAHLRTAYTSCREAVAMLDQAIAHLNTYLTLILGLEPWQLTKPQVEKLRAELPSPITSAERNTGRKTRGRWIGADGVTHPIVSGASPLSAAANKILQGFGFEVLYVREHAEMKLATYLRQRYERTGTAQHVSVVLNQVPCPGPLGCAKLLPVMLPAGCTLTVYAPNYRRTFTGGATP